MKTNRRILIDNATLSGVERILGVSKTINLSNLGNDILCLEKLVTSILFSDHLIAVDDYKEKFRSDRLKEFKFVNFLKINQENYNKISSDAASFAKSMVFSFEGSKPSGDVAKFFEALKIDPQLRWDVWVSGEYLTLSYLVNNTKHAVHEKAIDSMFRNEEVDQKVSSENEDIIIPVSVKDRSDVCDVKDLANVLSSENPQYSGHGHKSALQRILFGYGWAAERSYFYNAIACAENADAYLAPLRDAFCESCVRIDYPSQTISLIESLKCKSNKAFCSIVEASGRAKFAMKLPFFVSYLISKVDNPRQCIELALEIRDKVEFQECRTIFHNLSFLESDKRTKEINSIFRYLDQSCENLMKKYAVSTNSGLNFSVSFGITGVNMNLSGKFSQLLREYKYRPFSRVFRNIAQDMVNIERLGELHDKLRRSIREHNDANHPSIQTTPKFMEKRENDYGRPVEL